MPPVTLTDEEARVIGALDGEVRHHSRQLPVVDQRADRPRATRRRTATRSCTYGEDQVERALETLREKGLSRRIKTTGQRVVKHRQTIDESLKLTAPEFAILGVLLLRGAQTPGELKGRTERWHTFRSLDDVEQTLQRLAAGEFIVQLPRRPGQKEQRWMQLLAPTPEPAAWVAPSAPAPVGAPAGATPAAGGAAGPPPAVEAEPRPPAAPEAHSVEIRNPATGELVRTVAVTEAGEIEQKLRRAPSRAGRMGGAPVRSSEPRRCVRSGSCSRPKPTSARR